MPATVPGRPPSPRRIVRGKVVFERRAASGVIQVVDCDSERRLVVDGSVLSIIPRDGNWDQVRREYWWHALAAIAVPRRPSALFVGLGGGTQIHLLHQISTPRLVTVIERDPWIVRVANRWFGLRPLGRLEILCADAEVAAATLAQAGRSFDVVIEDAAYGDEPESAQRVAEASAMLVAPGGALVVNRHRRADARALVTVLAPLFEAVTVRRVRREAENLLVCGRGARPRGTAIEGPGDPAPVAAARPVRPPAAAPSSGLRDGAGPTGAARRAGRYARRRL
jgi:spermidine synthase